MSTSGICSVCNTFLRLEDCWQCDGTGHLRAWLVFRRACPLCSGAGQRALCPDRSEHLFASAARQDHEHGGHARHTITRFARDRVRSVSKAPLRSAARDCWGLR